MAVSGSMPGRQNHANYKPRRSAGKNYDQKDLSDVVMKKTVA